MSDNSFTESELDAAIADITDEDLRQRSQALHDAQEAWEDLKYISTPKMPCPECGGSGSIHGGSFGDICVGCMGARVVDAPGVTHIDMPPFAELRAAITRYGDSKADRALPVGHVARKNLALPPASSVPTLESLVLMKATAIGQAKQLRAAGADHVIDPKQLPAARPARGLSGEGDLGEYSDAELAEMEDAAKDDNGGES